MGKFSPNKHVNEASARSWRLLRYQEMATNVVLGMGKNMSRSKSTKAFTLANLEYLNKQQRLWLNPEYQRESVWTRSQKQLLIDSLLREIDIPKLYFRETTHAGYKFEVVDGQQRLRTIFEYFSSDFELQDDADSVESIAIAGCKMTDLHTDIQMKLRDTQLDVVVMTADYTDDDIEEIFLRLQNGTPLNAQEKRRALPGNMRRVVQKLSRHKFFELLCGFSSRRFAYEDAVAKTLHLLLAGAITDIRGNSIRRTYEAYRDIKESNQTVSILNRAYEFMLRAFSKKAKPKFKKYAAISMPYLVAELLETYNINEFQSEFARAYLKFEQRRIENDDLEEDEQDPRLAAYSNAARADSIQDLEYRHETLRREIVSAIPQLERKDDERIFSQDQRLAIYIRDKGKCKLCGSKCRENAFHADHKKPYSKGGRTTISNGQLLCPSCNLKKGKKSNADVELLSARRRRRIRGAIVRA